MFIFMGIITTNEMERNMKKTIVIMLSIILIFFTGIHLAAKAKVAGGEPSISGRIVGGYRILPPLKRQKENHLVVYRGDYIKFALDPTTNPPVLLISSLSIQKKLSKDLGKTPYFKMKRAGTFVFSLGDIHGDITVIEYQQARYQAVTAAEAAEIIGNTKPLVLDVRTPREYKTGHLKNSVLIPVQELQSRLDELAAYKNEDILVYCATGNRSTVASKILIDHGFKRIMNLRYGISEWGRKNFPIFR